MKGKKLITLVLASLAIGALASCGGGTPSSSEVPSSSSVSPSSSEIEPLPQEYSLMKYWAGNQAEEYYKVTESADKTTISYTDVPGENAGGWAYVSRAFAYDAAYISRFSEYKKVSFTGKLTAESGSDVVMVKVEGAGGTFEKRFNFKSETSTYEFGLSFVSDWTQVSAILFFVNRNYTDAGTGLITLDKFVLSKDEVDPRYDIAPGMPDIPQDWNIYNGEESLSVMKSWGYDATETIVTEGTVEGYTFSWNGKAAGSEWAYVSAMIKGNTEHPLATSGMKRLVFEIKATAGTSALFKFQTKDNAKNKEVPLNFELGTEQKVIVDVQEVLAASTNDEFLACIFPDQGVTGDDKIGSILLSSCYFDKNDPGVDEKGCVADYGAVWLDKFTMIDPCYKVNVVDHVTTINYTKAAAGWESIQTKVSFPEDWWNPQDYTVITGSIKADVDVKVLLKAYDSKEFWIPLTAGTSIPIDVKIEKSIVDVNKVFCIFICAGDDAGALTGTVTITNLRLSRPETIISNTDELFFNKVGAKDACFAVTEDLTGIEVNYTKAAPGWESIQFFTSAPHLEEMTHLSATVVSTVNTSVLFKPGDNNANEKKVQLLAGEEVTVDYDFAVPVDLKWVKSTLFIATDEVDAVEGKVTFTNFKLINPRTIKNVASYASVYLDNFSHVDPCYSVSHEGSTTTVEFDKGAPGYESIWAGVTLPEDWWDIKNFTRITGTFTSDVDVTVLLKAYDDGRGENLLSLSANTPREVNVAVPSEICSLEKNFIIFIGTGAEDTLQGTLEITDLRLSWDKACLEKEKGLYLDSIAVPHPSVTSFPDGDYTGMTVTITNPTDEYIFSQIFVSARDISMYNGITGSIECSKDITVGFKVNDNDCEQTFDVVGGTPFALDYHFSTPIDAKWVKIQLFFHVNSYASATIHFGHLALGVSD